MPENKSGWYQATQYVPSANAAPRAAPDPGRVEAPPPVKGGGAPSTCSRGAESVRRQA